MNGMDDSTSLTVTVNALLGTSWRLLLQRLPLSITLILLGAAFDTAIIILLDDLTPGWIMSFALGVVFEFILIRSLAERVGFRIDTVGSGFAGFFTVYVVSTAGIIIGSLLFIIPGLIFFGRWFPAPALALTELIGTRQALAKSWRMTEGNAWKIHAALLIAYLPMAVALLLSGWKGMSMIEPVIGDHSANGLYFLESAISWSCAAFVSALSVAYLWLLRRDHDEVVGKFR